MCDVPGCKHKATAKVLVEKIYHGIFSSIYFHYCECHTEEELKNAELKLTEKHAKSCMMCDPMEESRSLMRKKPYELGKAAS